MIRIIFIARGNTGVFDARLAGCSWPKVNRGVCNSALVEVKRVSRQYAANIGRDTRPTEVVVGEDTDHGWEVEWAGGGWWDTNHGSE